MSDFPFFAYWFGVLSSLGALAAVAAVDLTSAGDPYYEPAPTWLLWTALLAAPLPLLNLLVLPAAVLHLCRPPGPPDDRDSNPKRWRP